MKTWSLKTLAYTLLFGIVSGAILTFALSFFIPEFFTDWAGSFVCPGRIEFVRFKQTYYCHTAANASFEVGDAMFRAVFRRFIFLAVPVCFLFALGFVKLGEFLYKRRDEAGF